MDIVYRKNKLFCINRDALPKSAQREDVIQALYAVISVEFRGAEENDKYRGLSFDSKMKLLNEFVKNWLTIRGYK